MRSLDRGGAERQAVILARGLLARGVDTSVLLFYRGGALEEALAGTEVEVVHLDKRGRWDLPRFTWRLVRALRERRPSIVYGFLPTANLLLALTRPLHGRPIAFGLFGAARPPEARLLARFERRVEPALARVAEVVITKSTAGRDDALARGFPARKVRVVPNGIDGSQFRFDGAAGTALRRSLGASGPLIGIVARLDPIKDHETFLAAFALVLDAHPSALALVVGSDPGGRAEQLRATAAAGGFADRVVFTGVLDNLVDVYSACHVVVVSSRSESGPAVLLEALACGTAGAATDVGHVRSILGDDRLVAPVGDPEGLARGIEVALSLPRDEEARQARRARVLDAYGADRMTEDTMSALGRGPWQADAAADRASDQTRGGVSMKAIEVPDEALRYILLQRTKYLRLPTLPGYRVLNRLSGDRLFPRVVALEARVTAKRVKQLYAEDMQREYDSIKPHLPPSCSQILDIGCGIAGIDVLLSRHYGGDGVRLHLLDKSEQPAKVYYSFKERGAFYNSLEIAKELLVRNGVAPESLVLLEANERNEIGPVEGFDLVLSLISWGFHYPVETYLAQVFDAMAPDGTLVLDVRRGTEGLDLLRERFGDLTIVGEDSTSFRVCAVKRGPAAGGGGAP